MYTQRSTKKFLKPTNLTLKKAKLLSTKKAGYLINVEYFVRLLQAKQFPTHLKLRHQHLDTVKFVYNTYTNRYLSDDLRSVFRSGNIPRNLPIFKTYLSSIATETLRTPRSARAHRNRLYDCGLLETYFHHDSERCQHWELNPIFLLPPELCTTLVEKWVDKAEKLLNAPDFPTNQNPLRTALNAIKGEEITPLLFELDIYSKHYRVDKADAGVPPAIMKTRHKPDINRTPGKEAKRKYNLSDKKFDETRERGENSSSLFANLYSKEEVARRRAKIPPFLLTLLLNFWQEVQDRLYPEWRMKPELGEQVVVLLSEHIYNPGEVQATKKGWLRYHECLLRRVRLTQRWCDRTGDPPPHPLFFFRPPPDGKLESTFNFYRTNDLLAKAEYQRILREARQYAHGKGRYREKTVHEVLKIHADRMVETYNMKYRQQFAAVMNKIYNPQYWKKSRKKKYG